MYNTVYKNVTNERSNMKGEVYFVATFREKIPINMSECSFLVLGGSLDTGSLLGVVEDCHFSKCSFF